MISKVKFCKGSAPQKLPQLSLLPSGCCRHGKSKGSAPGQNEARAHHAEHTDLGRGLVLRTGHVAVYAVLQLDAQLACLFAREVHKRLVIHALHIEDKIDAVAMPRQPERYDLRAQKDIAAGEYDTYSVLIVAPEKYLRKNKEAQKYPSRLTYEQMRTLLATAIHQFAKRQMTWFRGMERKGIRIHWTEV